MRKKLLVLSWGVPPTPAGVGVVMGNLAKQFRRDEMILVGEKTHGDPPAFWSDDWPEVVHNSSEWPFTRRGIRWWRMMQTPYMLWHCWRLMRRRDIGDILAVYPDSRFLLIGYLCARLTHRRLFVYFHNTYVENRTGLARRFGRWLQSRVFQYAEHVFVMSEGMSEFYRERYPGLHQTPLVHSFNEPIPCCNVPTTVASPMNVVFCGTVNASCEEAAIRMGEAVAACPDVRLTIYGMNKRSRLEAIGLLREGMECATVSREELLARMREADVLLLPHGFTGDWPPEEYRTIFPTKTIEFLLSGRPILAHAPPDCFITRFLQKNDCALIVDTPDVGALREALERLRTDYPLRRRLAENALATAKQFKAENVAAELRKWINREGISAERSESPRDTTIHA